MRVAALLLLLAPLHAQQRRTINDVVSTRPKYSINDVVSRKRSTGRPRVGSSIHAQGDRWTERSHGGTPRLRAAECGVIRFIGQARGAATPGGVVYGSDSGQVKCREGVY